MLGPLGARSGLLPTGAGRGHLPRRRPVGAHRRRRWPSPPCDARGGSSAGLVIIAVAVAAAALPLRAWIAASSAPPIHDVTTDLDNPPRYVAVAKLRVPPANSVDYGGEAVARQQRASYGDLRPLIVHAPPPRVLALAADTARAEGWTVLAQDIGFGDLGRLEATDTSFLFGRHRRHRRARRAAPRRQPRRRALERPRRRARRRPQRPADPALPRLSRRACGGRAGRRPGTADDHAHAVPLPAPRRRDDRGRRAGRRPGAAGRRHAGVRRAAADDRRRSDRRAAPLGPAALARRQPDRLPALGRRLARQQADRPRLARGGGHRRDDAADRRRRRRDEPALVARRQDHRVHRQAIRRRRRRRSISCRSTAARRRGSRRTTAPRRTALAWSPDGTALSSSRPKPKTAAEKAREKAKDDVYVFDEDYKQVHLWRVELPSPGRAARRGQPPAGRAGQPPHRRRLLRRRLRDRARRAPHRPPALPTPCSARSARRALAHGRRRRPRRRQ